MIEIEFDSMDDAVEALNELSYLGKAKIDKKINHEIITRNYYLNSNYEKALDALKNAEKTFEAISHDENDESPMEYLYTALSVLEKLFKSGKFRELGNKDLSEAEDKLFEIVAEIDVNDKFRNLEILKKEMGDAFKNITTSPIKKPCHDDDVKESDSPAFEKSDESHPDNTLDHEGSNFEDADDSGDSKLPDNNNFDKFLKIMWKRHFLINPILESVYFHRDSEDPYSCFTNNVYLNVTSLEDLFIATDLRMKILSNTHVSYVLNIGLEFILQEKELIDSLYELPVVNEDVFEQIQMVSILVHEILSSLEKSKKVKYRKFIFDMTDRINNDIFSFEDLDVEYSIDSDFIELIIKDLDKIGLIKTKGKKIIKYALK